MAQLVVDLGNAAVRKPLVFHFATVRTQSYTCEPVLDASGQHYEATKITLRVCGLVNAVTIATNKLLPNQVGGQKANRTDPPVGAGDSLPFTMFNVRDALMHPRRPVTFQVADTRVFDLPRPLQPNFPDGPRMPSDLRGGPYPQRAVWTNIAGEKTAILDYEVVGYDSYNEQVLLTHSWSVQHSIDRHGLTTRTVQGRATFRMDVLDSQDVVPDDFRKAIFHAVPDGFRRVGVYVDQASDSRTYDYTVVDREVVLGLGENSPLYEITGSVTGGVIHPLRDPKAIGNAIQRFGRAAVNVMDDPFGPIGELWANAVPTSVSTGVARAIGRKGVSRRTLSMAAMSFILDRFSPMFNAGGGGIGIGLGGAAGGAAGGIKFTEGRVVSIHVTHNVDTDGNPWAECRLELLGLNVNAIQAIMQNDPEKLMKLDEEIKPLQGNLVVASGQRDGPALPNGGGTRGTATMIRMLTQALQAPTGQQVQTDANLPGDPPENRRARDIDDAV